MLERLLMPAARSKRCRENRPLTEPGRLAERERPADFSGSSMQDQVALGAQRSPGSVKGGIARAAGSQKRGSAHGAWAQTVGRITDQMRRSWCRSRAFLNFHEGQLG